MKDKWLEHCWASTAREREAVWPSRGEMWGGKVEDQGWRNGGNTKGEKWWQLPILFRGTKGTVSKFYQPGRGRPVFTFQTLTQRSRQTSATYRASESDGSCVWVTLGSCRVPLQRELQSGPVEGYKCNWGHVGQEMGLQEWSGDYSFWSICSGITGNPQKGEWHGREGAPMAPPWTQCSMTRRPRDRQHHPRTQRARVWVWMCGVRIPPRGTRRGLSSPWSPASMQPRNVEPENKTATGTRTRPLLGGGRGGEGGGPEGPESRNLGQLPSHQFPGASAPPASGPAKGSSTPPPRPGKEGRAEAAGSPFRCSLWGPLPAPPRDPHGDPRPLARPGVLRTGASTRP